MLCFSGKEKQGHVFVVSSLLFLLILLYCCKFVNLVKIMYMVIYRKKDKKYKKFVREVPRKFEVSLNNIL